MGYKLTRFSSCSLLLRKRLVPVPHLDSIHGVSSTMEKYRDANLGKDSPENSTLVFLKEMEALGHSARQKHYWSTLKARPRS